VSGVLGVSVGTATIHAVLARGKAVGWAGRAEYRSRADLTEALARLVAECAVKPRRVRVVLERGMVQLRSIAPAPPLRARALAAYVALEAPRLFRNGSGPLLTDAALQAAGAGRRLWAGAADDATVRSLVDGCRQAGLALDAVGPAADVLPAALAAPAGGSFAIRNGAGTEMVEIAGGRTLRSRLVASGEGAAPEWVAPLAALGEEAPHFAAAYAAALARPRLLFLPKEALEARRIRAARALRRLAAATAGLWLLAGAVYAVRLGAAARAADREMAAMGAAVDSALAVRRDLDAATGVMATIARAEGERSRHLALLAALTRALPDSSVVVSLRVAPDSTVRLSGYAAGAARVLARIEQVSLLRGARLEGSVTREVLGAGTPQQRSWDRFALVARLQAHDAPRRSRRGVAPEGEAMTGGRAGTAEPTEPQP